MQQNEVLGVTYSEGDRVVVFADEMSPSCAHGVVVSVSKYNLKVRFDDEFLEGESGGPTTFTVTPAQTIPEDASPEEIGARLEHYSG